MPEMTDPQPFTYRWELLNEALKCVTGDRNIQYGDPSEDFKRVAALWSAYLGITISPDNVAVCQILLKISRLTWNPQHKDSWVDIAGYAACGYETQQDYLNERGDE
jgi:hypothetical protein